MGGRLIGRVAWIRNWARGRGEERRWGLKKVVKRI